MIPFVLIAACGPPRVDAVVVDGAVEVISDRALRRVEVSDAAGRPVLSQILATPSRNVWLPAAPGPGEHWTVRAEARGGAVAVAEVGPAGPATVARPEIAGPIDPADIVVRALRCPTDAFGRPDTTLPTDRIVRPLFGRSGIGWRPPPDQAPWTWQALTLENRGAHPADLVVRASVETEAGAPVPSFRSRVRSQEGLQEVSVLLRVPPGATATATLPVYVDLAALPDGTYVRHLDVLQLGGAEVIVSVERPLVVGGGGALAPVAFGVALAVAVAGFGWLAATGRRRLRVLSTADLVTISLFGALTFVVGAAFQLLGFGIAAVLGPFAPLVSGLFDDAFRACLLATLVTTIPRPGVVATATVVGAIIRALTLGSVHPVDLLFVGTAVGLHEACLWIAGVTRSGSWREAAPVVQWVRLSAGFGVANALSVGLGLATTAVLYRLYFAAWYVAFLVLVPGLLYVVFGCLFAVPFAASLRRVAP